MEGPGQAVGRGFPRLGQRRGDRAVLGQLGQALEDVGVDDFIHRRRRARGRIKVRRLQRQAQHQTLTRRLRLNLRRGQAPDEAQGQRQHKRDQAGPKPAVPAAPSGCCRDACRPCLRHLPSISPLRRGRSSSAYVMDLLSRHGLSAPHHGWRASEAGQAAVLSVAAARAASNSSFARAKSAWNAGSAFSRVTMVAPTMRPASTSLG